MEHSGKMAQVAPNLDAAMRIALTAGGAAGEESRVQGMKRTKTGNGDTGLRDQV